MVRPRLVLVSGRPGSGKTTQARRLADERALWLPLLSADALRTGMGDALDAWHDDPATTPAPATAAAAATAPSGQVVFDVFYRTVESLLRNGVSLIAEASYLRGLDERRLRPLLDLTRVAHVHCALPIDLARERFLTREPTRRRRSGGGDIPGHMQRGEFDLRPFDPLALEVPGWRSTPVTATVLVWTPSSTSAGEQRGQRERRRGERHAPHGCSRPWRVTPS